MFVDFVYFSSCSPAVLFPEMMEKHKQKEEQKLKRKRGDDSDEESEEESEQESEEEESDEMSLHEEKGEVHHITVSV